MSNRALFAIPIDVTGESTRLVRTAIFVILFLVGGVVAWGAFAPISGAVVASGIIKVDTNRKSVQHFEGGIIREILVREGQQVEARQPLILLDDTDSSSSLNILTDALHALQAKEARLIAEASLSDVIAFPGELTRDATETTLALVENEQSLFKAKRKTLFDQINLIEDEIRHAGDAVSNLESQAQATNEGLRYVQEQLEAGEQLVKKRAIDNNSILELKRKSAAARESLWQQKAEVSLQQQEVAGLKLRIVNLKNDYSKNAEDELKETRKVIFETRERIRPVQNMLQRKTIRASIAGQVINLNATTIGGVVKPGETVLEIVPKVRDLAFEVKIRPRDSDNVYVGQSAKIQLSAYNQRSTPLIDGALIYLSGDAITDKGSNDQEPYFLAHIRVDPESLTSLGDRPLSPGMPVIAFVQTEARTFFEYVLSPVTAGMRRALVEDIH